MKTLTNIFLPALFLSAVFTANTSAATPPAPALLSPASGTSVAQPFTATWTGVTDPTGIIGYNWQISPASSFANIVGQGSTSGATQASISGLPSGSYFLRVQSVNGSVTQSAWSAANSIAITGTGPGGLQAPVLQPTKAYSTFHPYEVEVFEWSTVPGAVTYRLQFSLDSTFPVIQSSTMDNLATPTTSFAIGNPEGNYFARAYAVDANGNLSAPSNTISFSVFFTNPIGPPPATISPVTGGTVTLPIRLSWADVPNPQPNGYEFEIAKDSAFKTVEIDYPQDNDPFFVETSLTPGPKFWRVRSTQGDSSPTLPAETAWSQTGTFTISAAPPGPVSIMLANPLLYSGDTTVVQIQLTAAVPAGGAAISLTSSNQTAFPVPASVQMQGNLAWMQFSVQMGQVTIPTPVTFTASINSQSTSIQITVLPPSLKSLQISPSSITGSGQPQLIVMLNGQAPAGGAIISLSSNSPAVMPPATATAPAGSFSASLPINTSTVSANTPATVTATWQGESVEGQVTVLPALAPVGVSLSPASIVGGNGSFSTATVTLTSAAQSANNLQIAVSNPSVATQVPASITIPTGASTATFSILPTAVTVSTPVTISVSGGGQTVSAVLTVTPGAQVPVSALAVSPVSVNGGSASTGTVTLASVAPAGGASVALSSSSAFVTVPASVIIGSGATSATFPISTTAVSASTSATITAAAGASTRTATLTVNPAPQTAAVTVTASGRSGTNVISSPAGINVASGSSGQGTFTIGTAVTLSVTSGRDAIWSGGCSSGGNKAKACSFTVSAPVSVSAAIQ